MSETPENSKGFWRLEHDSLAALLARADMCWGDARVYLALGDLTLGYRKERDRVSLSQIAKRAGMSVRHVTSAIKRLKAAGLYGQCPANGQSMTRWIIWPAPATVAADTTVTADSSTTVEQDTRTTVAADTGTTVAGDRHQEDKRKKNEKELRTPSAADPRIAEFISWFCIRFKEVRGVEYVVSHGRDRKLIQGLSQKLSLDELKARAEAMLAHKFWSDKASIPTLSAHINEFLGKASSVRLQAADRTKYDRFN